MGDLINSPANANLASAAFVERIKARVNENKMKDPDYYTPFVRATLAVMGEKPTNPAASGVDKKIKLRTGVTMAYTEWGDLVPEKPQMLPKFTIVLLHPVGFVKQLVQQATTRRPLRDSACSFLTTGIRATCGRRSRGT